MMTACEFVIIDDYALPAVAGVQLVPQYVTDSERSISGVLRTDHTAVLRVWRVTLRGVPGEDVYPLLAALQTPIAPRAATVMGEEATVEVRVDNVTHRPRIRSARPDHGRADMVLTLTEVNPPAVSP